MPEPLQEGSRRLDLGETVALRESLSHDLHVRHRAVLLIFGRDGEKVRVDGNSIRAFRAS